MVDRRDETDGAEDNRMDGAMGVAYDSGIESRAGHAGPWTLEQVLALPEDRSQRVELVDGVLMMSPHASTLHQRVLYKLRDLLARAGEGAGADVEVFTEINVMVPCGLLVPDVVVVDAAAVVDGPLAVASEAVRLVVEVISPYNRRADMHLKPKLYAEAAIPSFWRVDPQPAPRIFVDEFEAGGYVTRQSIEAGKPVRVDQPFPVLLEPRMLVVR